MFTAETNEWMFPVCFIITDRKFSKFIVIYVRNFCVRQERFYNLKLPIKLSVNQLHKFQEQEFILIALTLFNEQALINLPWNSLLRLCLYLIGHKTSKYVKKGIDA